MNNVRKAGIVIKPHAPSVEGILKIVVEYFESRGIVCVLEDVAARKLGRADGLERAAIAAASDLVVVLGGDGTLLSVAHHAAQAGVPVMGINLGRLGFLTEIPVSEAVQTLDRFLGWRCVSHQLPRTPRGPDGGRYVVLPERRRHHQGSRGPDDRAGHLRRRPGRGDAQGGRPHRLDADGLDGLFALGRRPYPPPASPGHRPDADLPPHAVLPAHGRSGDLDDRRPAADRRGGGPCDLRRPARRRHGPQRRRRDPQGPVRASAHHLAQRSYYDLVKEKLGWAG